MKRQITFQGCLRVNRLAKQRIITFAALLPRRILFTEIYKNIFLQNLQANFLSWLQHVLLLDLFC